MTPAEYDAFAARIPKISLHLHLTGSVAPDTVVDLARKHDVPLPAGRDVYDIDAHADLDAFLRVYDTIGEVVRDADDFHRVTYETLALAARHNVLYREMFLSPPAHPHTPYPVMLDGVVRGLRDAETDHGVVCRLIVALDRERDADEGRRLVETVIEHRDEHVIGIGLDYAEVNGPPERFRTAFALAGRAGLHRTAHSESGPPANIRTLLDDLGCTRVDHGYHVVTDAEMTARCRDEGVPFTCTPVSSDIGRYSGSGDGTHRRIVEMLDAGLAVTIDSDDPPMFGTDPTHDLRVLGPALGFDPAPLRRMLGHAVDACWLDDTDRAALRARVDAVLKEDPCVN
jgi:adenosine deaminase